MDPKGFIMDEVKSNIDIESNIVIATRWNRLKYHLILWNWWIIKGKVTKLIWTRR
jgi:hypothetical protein